MNHIAPSSKSGSSGNSYAVLAKLPSNYGLDKSLRTEQHPKKQQTPDSEQDWVDLEKPPAHQKEERNGQGWLKRLLPNFLSR